MVWVEERKDTASKYLALHLISRSSAQKRHKQHATRHQPGVHVQATLRFATRRWYMAAPARETTCNGFTLQPSASTWRVHVSRFATQRRGTSDTPPTWCPRAGHSAFCNEALVMASHFVATRYQYMALAREPVCNVNVCMFLILTFCHYLLPFTNSLPITLIWSPSPHSFIHSCLTSYRRAREVPPTAP